MSAVALIYVGAVLILNGIMLLGWLTPREAAPLNLFVGGIQIFTPTFLIVTSGGDSAAIVDAAGIYLFGFTYLWVGIDAVAGITDRGLGWFSLFVALCAVIFGLVNVVRVGDVSFGVIWWLWAVLWFCFFLVLGLERSDLASQTGFYTIAVGAITAVVAFLLLLGQWQESGFMAVTFGVVGVLCLIGAVPAGPRLTRPSEPAT